MSSAIRLAVCGVTLFIATSASAADWPQWRGPARDGVSQETGLLPQWPSAGPKLVWRVDNLGEGLSTPAVVGERIYVNSSEGMENEYVEARNVADGSRIWTARLGNVGPNRGPQHPTARSTPTVDGELLYALGSDGDLACVETATGKIRWKKNLPSDFGGKAGNWAYAESPLVDGDRVIVTPGGSDATMVALDKATGEPVWKSAIPGGDEAAYASAIIVNAAGKKQYVQFLGKGLAGVDAATGKFLWRYDRTAKGSSANIPSPVARDGMIYSSAGRVGGALVKPAAVGGGIAAEEVYFSPALPNAIGGSVLVGDNLYGTARALMCVDFATGDVKWEDRSIAPAALLAAEGRLYLHSEAGEVALVEASAAGYRELGRFTPPGRPEQTRDKAWAYPVVANGKLYIREQQALWSYDIAAK